jgi:hypothetical protein
MENCPYWEMSSGTEKTTSKSQKLPNMKTEGKAIV